MATKSMLPREGSCCAVATCTNNASKVKLNEKCVSFYRFPKDPECQKKWIIKCRRSNKINPALSYMCSEHFCEDSYVRDPEAELLGCTPKTRKLKADAMPTLNLPKDHTFTSVAAATSANTNKSRMDSEIKNEDKDDDIALKKWYAWFCNEFSSTVMVDKDTASFTKPNYETMYNGLLKTYEDLKNNIIPNLLSDIKKYEVEYQKNNEFFPIYLKIINKKKIKLRLTAKAEAKKYLSTLFSKNQIDLIMKKKRVHWSTDDISKALTLRYLSKQAYIYIKDELHYPLPDLASLQRWTKNIDMRNGILEDVIKMMQLNGSSLQDYEKLTILMFDKVKISRTIEYDVLHDEVVGPFSQMQVVMARGIAAQWKQPIFVNFDKKMTKEILFSIIERLDKIGFNVLCCVSDCEGENIDLWKSLDITFEQPIFSTPNGKEIVYIPNAAHILKLIRNWLVDTGFQFQDQLINKNPLESLIKKTSTEINVCYKLTEEHLTCKGPQRQKIRLASQLLSHPTATALLHYKPIDDTKLLNDTANFIELVNNWFDLSNVSHPNNHSTPYTAPYGLFLEEQDSLLNEMFNTFLLMRCNGKYGLQTFQKALLMHINGLKLLLKIVCNNGLKYILTSKLNQDVLENLFLQLQNMNGLNDHPSPLDALYRLRMVILGKSPVVVSNQTNISDGNNEEFLVATTIKQVDLKLNDVCENIKNIESDTDTPSDSESIINSCNKRNEMVQDAAEYLTDWITKTYRHTFPELVSTTEHNSNESPHEHDYVISSGISHSPYDGLISPSHEFKKNILRIESLFKKITKQQIPKGQGVVKNLTKKIFSRMEMADKYYPVVQTYIKERLLIKMKYLNHQIASHNKKKKKKAK